MNSVEWISKLGPTGQLLAGFVTVLVLLTLAGGAADRAIAPDGRWGGAVRRLNKRLYGLWGIVVVFSLAMLTGGLGSILVFAATSFLLLREFITITPTRAADHRSLTWAFFVILPVQYLVLGCNWYGLFVILIPVYAFLFIPVRIAAGDDPVHFMERTAKIQWALMVCVYCVSYAPALIKLTLPGHEGAGARLLLFLCIVVQANDAVHEFVDAMAGRHRLSNRPGCSRTLDGFVAGSLTGAALGAVMAGVTPMTVGEAAAMGALISVMGSAGQLCLSMIRDERGRDGVVVVRRGQDMMSRAISLCFAAPVFFHIVRFKFAAGDIGLF